MGMCELICCGKGMSAGIVWMCHGVSWDVSVDVSGAGYLPDPSSYPFGALHLHIPNNYLILAF